MDPNPSSIYNECKAYCQIINKVLHPKSKKFPSDIYSFYLPVTPETLLERCRDGILLAYLLVDIAPETRGSLARLTPCFQAPTSALSPSSTNTVSTTNATATNTPTTSSIDGSTNVFVLHSNVTTVLSTMARAAGIVVVNASPADIVAMKKEQVLGVVWQIVRAHVLCHLSVRNCEELVLLMREDEQVDTFLRSKPETLLIRWVNYHLERSGWNKQFRRVLRNLPKDLVDCEIYVMLMHELFPKHVDSQRVEEFFAMGHLVTRVHYVVELFETIDDGECIIEPIDIIEENAKLSVAFLCQMFDIENGLSLLNAEEAVRKRVEELRCIVNAEAESLYSMNVSTVSLS